MKIMTFAEFYNYYTNDYGNGVDNDNENIPFYKNGYRKRIEVSLLKLKREQVKLLRN